MKHRRSTSGLSTKVIFGNNETNLVEVTVREFLQKLS